MIRILINLLLILTCLSCRNSEESRPVKYYFTLNYRDDSREKHLKGLLWTFSYLGAELRKGALDSCITWYDSLTFSLDFKKAGFSQSAVDALEKIEHVIDTGTYYRKFGKADFGQFVALTIGVSAHYYKITGVPLRYDQMLAQHESQSWKIFPVIRSTVAKGHRRLKFSAAGLNPAKWIFIAEEGEGSLIDSTFVPTAYEIMDIMPNGQLRCSIYGRDGNLLAASPKSLGEAGKPAKCLWCHEIVIQPLFESNPDLAGHMTTVQFHDELKDIMKRLQQYRSALNGEIDFHATQDHTFMELEYIPYMQPSVSKLAKQWNLPETEVKVLLKDLTFSDHEEFGILGPLIDKAKVNTYNEWFPFSIREPGPSEFNIFKDDR